MYWPTAVARVIAPPSPTSSEPILHLRPNRKATLYATVTKSGFGIWSVRPNVLLAAVTRTPKSLERWGTNVDVTFAHDGRGVIVLTSTSHLLVYQLEPTSAVAYDSAPSPLFLPGGGPGEGDALSGWTLRSLGTAFIMGSCSSLYAQPHSLFLTLRNPPSILTVPYPIPVQLLAPVDSHHPPPPLDGDGEEQQDCELWDLTQGRDFLGPDCAAPVHFSVSRTHGTPALYVMITEDGRAWGMHTVSQAKRSQPSTGSAAMSPITPVASLPRIQVSPVSRLTSSIKYVGQAVHPIIKPQPVDKEQIIGLGLEDASAESSSSTTIDRAREVAVNSKFGLIAIGTDSGLIHFVSLPGYPQPPRLSHTLDLKQSAALRTSPGAITALAWTSDGYGLAVGYEHGWAIWSVGGRLGGWGMTLAEGDKPENEGFMNGLIDAFWSPGNCELFVLAHPPHQLYAIPFAKSATTSQHSPDNTRYAFLQMDDRLLVYRGADQPDMSVINPESDVWQHITIPSDYISINWPVRYASISSDGRLIAVAGSRGLTHYSVGSGRWKLFHDERQERDFVVRGGLLWFHHVLIAAIEVDKTYQIRLYSRDMDLDDVNILHSQTLSSPVLVMTLLDNSLLVYTADNTLYHYLIIPTRDAIKLHLCGSISFLGIIQAPTRVRALSWLIPDAQKHLGDPADDLIVATIIFLVDSRLVLLRPRKAGNDEVRYDMQVLAEHIESYWTHLQGIGTLENSLWGYDGVGLRVWLDALTIEDTKVDAERNVYESVKETVYLPLDFCPLSILMDKGIIIGVDYETSSRALPFSLFKIATGTKLFLPQFMKHHLISSPPPSSALTPLGRALIFASTYAPIVYFAHSLEILLHSVLEDDEGTPHAHLHAVIDFLDHFPQALDVVVGCARKTEIDRWATLFDAAGTPRALFERCLKAGKFRTAASYLLVLQNLEELDDVNDTIRLLRLAMGAHEFQLCKELLRFLHSIDDSGGALHRAIEALGIAPKI